MNPKYHLVAGGLPEENAENLSQSELSKLLNRQVTICYEPIYRGLADFPSFPQNCLTAQSISSIFVQHVFPDLSYHPLDVTVRSFKVSMFTRPDFYFSRQMTKMIHRSIQAGLPSYSYTKSFRNYKICNLNTPEWLQLRDVHANRSALQDDVGLVHQLSMRHMSKIFHLLSLGLFLAGIVFIVERWSATKNVS